jgi:hypothetical protein
MFTPLKGCFDIGETLSVLYRGAISRKNPGAENLGKSRVQASYGVALPVVNKKIVSTRNPKPPPPPIKFPSQWSVRHGTVNAAIQ